MNTVQSKDGTTIAFTKVGEGQPVVLVTGALAAHGDPALAERLATDFTVYNYDRRGRGASGDTAPYAVEREIEDIAAVIDAAGGTASLYGISSGAGLALEAATHLPTKVQKLVLYEPPFIIDDSLSPLPTEYVTHLNELIAEGRRGDAVTYFMTAAVRLPEEYLAYMQNDPSWAEMEAVAHTIAYDGMVMGDRMSGKPLPADRWTAATMPTLVIAGSESEAFFRNGAQALVALLPDADYRILEGQDHNVSAEALAPILKEFFL